MKRDRPRPATRKVGGMEFISLKEVQRRTRISRTALLRAIAQGLLPAKQLSKSWYITPLWLDEYLGTPVVGREPNATPTDELRRAYRVLKMRVAENRKNAPRDAATTDDDDGEDGA